MSCNLIPGLNLGMGGSSGDELLRLQVMSLTGLEDTYRNAMRHSLDELAVSGRFGDQMALTKHLIRVEEANLNLVLEAIDKLAKGKGALCGAERFRVLHGNRDIEPE